MGNGSKEGNGVQWIWGTWAMGTGGRGTWVIGHMGIIMHRSTWGTGVMGHTSLSPLILQGSFSSFDSIYI